MSTAPLSFGFRRQQAHLFLGYHHRLVLALRCWAHQQVEQETALLKETVEGAAKVLSEAAATTKTATDAAKQASATRARATYLGRTSFTFAPAALFSRSITLDGDAPCPDVDPDDLPTGSRVGFRWHPRKHEEDGRVSFKATRVWTGTRTSLRLPSPTLPLTS